MVSTTIEKAIFIAIGLAIFALVATPVIALLGGLARAAARSDAQGRVYDQLQKDISDAIYAVKDEDTTYEASIIIPPNFSITTDGCAIRIQDTARPHLYRQLWHGCTYGYSFNITHAPGTWGDMTIRTVREDSTIYLSISPIP